MVVIKKIICLLMLLLPNWLHSQAVFNFVDGSTGLDKGVTFFQTDDKGFILFGDWDTESGTYYKDSWVTKLDSTGNYEWGWHFPALNNENTQDVAIGADGNYWVYGLGTYSSFLNKVSPLGTLVKQSAWTSEYRDNGLEIQPVNDTCFLTADNVYYASTPFAVDSITMCLTLRDSATNIIWRRIHNTHWDNARDATISLLSDNHILWTYPIKDSTIMEKVALNGSLIWRKRLPVGGCGLDYTTIQLNNGNIVLNTCRKLFCFDNNGNDVWSIDNYKVRGLSLIDSTKFYAIGAKTSWVDYGCDYPTYVTEHDYNGNFLRTKLYLYGYKCIDIQDFKTTNDGGWAFTGDVAPGLAYDIQLIFHKDDTLAPFVGIHEYIFEDNMTKYTMFPNPANTEIYLHLDKDVLGGEIQLQDLTGKVLSSQEINVTDKTMDVAMLPNGVYLISLNHKGYTETKKLVIQHN